MKVNYLLVIPLVLIGVGVGCMSLYMASLSGIMAKMGLVGGDFSQAVRYAELDKQISKQENDFDCGITNVAKNIPKYLLSKGAERVALSGQLGGERIICGVEHVNNRNVERGVYTIVKGLYYLKTHYSEMRILVERDRESCQLLKNPDYERWVEMYLNSTEGRINEVVLNVYKQVESERARVEELCMD
ncbi:hypothetical protein KBD75_03075 [Candidatus Woesebacteria bacterium]|nr:hypothetical protein [Candidatus Woesebacteria bacterium]